MNRWKNRVALVTGASVGIGAAVAQLLVRYGMTVIGCARNVEKIEAMAEEFDGRLVPVKCDLRREEEILEMFEMIKESYGGVDVCVNNAGLAKHPDSVISGSTECWRMELEVNVLALCICTREAVKQMLEKRADDGQIINISSIAGHRIVSSRLYAPSKFAVKAITEGTRRELREMNSHIRVSEISPGSVRTEFVGRVYGDAAKGEELYNSMEMVLEAEDVAALVVTVLEAPPHVQIHDILLRSTTQQL